jgi:DNA-binding phage protein
MPTLDYKEYLMHDLSDLEYAAGYLTAALEEGEAVFFLAVCDVADALGDGGELPESTPLNRDSVCRLLSERGGTRLSSLKSILGELGIEIQFRAKTPDTKVA